MEGDVPNVGVARALVVILAIHVVAIAGIFIHSRYFEPKTDSSTAGSKLSVVPGRTGDNKNQVKLGEGEKGRLISGGESYADIARDEGVDLKALQEANNNVELRAGNFLRLPPKQIVAVEPAAMTAVRESANGTPVNSLVSSTSTSTPAATGHDTLREGLPMVEANTTAKPPRAILVKPTVSASETGSRRTSEKPKDKEKVAASSRPKEAKAVTQATAAAPAKKTASTRVVKSGDTLWSIAKANGTTPAALMKANGIKDASKMRTGMELTIPKN
jgi:LysM repeat protein